MKIAEALVLNPAGHHTTKVQRRTRIYQDQRRKISEQGMICTTPGLCHECLHSALN